MISKTPANTASRKSTGIMHPNPGKLRRGRWWDSARFHLCLPPEQRDDVRQGAGRLFAWLGVGSVKIASPRPTWLSSLSRHTSGYPASPYEDLRESVRDRPQAVEQPLYHRIIVRETGGAFRLPLNRQGEDS